MIAGKTAALLGASRRSARSPAARTTRHVDAFAECGRLLGMAFQVQDDVLGIWGEPASPASRSPTTSARARSRSRSSTRSIELRAR